jgi:hypothetical protein
LIALSLYHSHVIHATGLNGTGIALNGQILRLDKSTGAVPDIGRMGKSVSAAGVFTLPPTSSTFVLFEDAKAAACM